MIKKKIFVRNREYSKNSVVGSSLFQSTRHSSNPAEYSGILGSGSTTSPKASVAKKSALTDFLNEDQDDENDF